MLELEWNALRVGDVVFVHDDDDPDLTIEQGVVVLIQGRRHAANDLGIRLVGPRSGVVRPRRHAVHILPPDRLIECWRCDANRQARGAELAA